MTKDTLTRLLLPRKLLIFVAIIYLLALALSLIIGQNTVILSGEYPFSFDYFGHVSAILKDFQDQPQTLLTLTTCIDCPEFYVYSRWFALLYYSFLGIGKYLGLHPFVFYISMGFLGEAIALYLLVRSLNLRFSSIAFLAAFFAFSYSPYKIRILSSGTMYHLHHAAMTLVLASWAFFLNNLKTHQIKLKHLLLFASSITLFFHVSINYLPIFIYTLVILVIVSFKSLITHIRQSLIFLGLSFSLALLLNFPMLLSLLRTGNTHSYSSYNALQIKDSLMANMFSPFPGPPSPVYTLSVSIFFLVMIFNFFNSQIPKKYKFFLAVVYFGVAIFMSGNQIPLHFTSTIFSHLPLMDSLRSLHRFLYFQLIIFFLVIYTGILHLRGSLKLLLSCLFSIVLAFPTFVFLYHVIFIAPSNFLAHSGKLPAEYFQAAQFLDTLQGSKIYLPHYGVHLNGSLTGNYSWLDVNVPQNSESIFTNPFTSLFSVPDLIFTEGYQLSTPQEAQLLYLLSYDRPPEEISTALSNLGIKYVVIDHNFFWNKNFPAFDIAKLENSFKLLSKFGRISIYAVEDHSANCTPSYGDFRLGYCYSPQTFKLLINRTPQDQTLDNLVLTQPSYVLTENPKAKISRTIVNPQLRWESIANGLLIPFPVFQVDNAPQSEIFTRLVFPGNYALFIPVFKQSIVNWSFQDSILEVYLGDALQSTISPYSSQPGIHWEEISIPAESLAPLTITAKGHGFIVLGPPLLIPSAEWKGIKSQLSSTTQFSDYKFNSEIDLLSTDTARTNGMALSPQTDYSTAFVTTALESSVEYDLKFPPNRHPESLQFVTSTAFLDSQSLGSLNLYTLKGKLVYTHPIYQAGKPVVHIDVPSQIIELSSNFRVKLMVKKEGVLLHRFVMRYKL